MPEIPLFARGGASEATLQELLAIVHGLGQGNGGGNGGGGTTGPIALDEDTIAAITTALEQVTVSGTVALDALTLAALEQTSATIANLPTDYPDALAATRLASLLSAIQALQATVDDGVTVTGNVVVANPVTTVSVSNLPTPQTDALTNTQLRATPVPVSGSVTISDGSGPVTVDGTVTANVTFPATQPVSGTVTVANPTTEVTAAVSGTVTAEDSGEREYTHVVATVTAAGDTTVYTPAAGKAVRLRWVYAVNDPTSSAAPLIKISLGGSEKYRAYALSKRQRVTGPVNGALVVNLSTTAAVAVTALLEEV